LPSIGIHPQITSLLRLKDEGREAMMKKDYKAGLETMYYISMEIKREDRDNVLFESIEKERITLRQFRYDGVLKKWMKERFKIYETWWETILFILDSKGYLSNDKYKSGFTPASTMPTANQPPEKRTFPARLRSDLDNDEEIENE